MKQILTVCMMTLMFAAWQGEATAQRYETPEEQAKAERKLDRKKILHSAEMRRDTDDALITIPEGYPEAMDFTVAKTPPAVDFAIVQGFEPWDLPSYDHREGGIYGGWGDVTQGPDGCFYFSIGNHMSVGGNAWIIRYDPATKTQKIVVDLRETIDAQPGQWVDGKFHGDPDIGPGGDMWLLTFFGPGPTAEDMEDLYTGSWLIHHNIFTGKTENLGIPLEGESWPYHCYDSERSLLFGVGAIKGCVIAYDTKERRMLYGAPPKDNITWYERGVMLDSDTGRIYTTDSPMTPADNWRDRYKGPQHFAYYERRNNTFVRMNAIVPPHPVTGKTSPMRAHTKRRNADGIYWCFDVFGGMFTFDPDEDRTESVGVNWGREGKYCSNICLSPGGRYLYYMPGADTHAYEYGTPVVQYDTTNGTKKVLAFLYDYYLDTYGYGAGGTYGIELDEKGESLFCYVNGMFTDRERGASYGRPAMFHIHIPESERAE